MGPLRAGEKGVREKGVHDTSMSTCNANRHRSHPVSQAEYRRLASEEDENQHAAAAAAAATSAAQHQPYSDRAALALTVDDDDDDERGFLDAVASGHTITQASLGATARRRV